MVLFKLLFKPIKPALKPLCWVFFKVPLKAFFNFSSYSVLIFLFYVVFKFISLTAFILARNIWPSITSGSIFADPDKLPTSTGLYAVSNPNSTSPSDPNPLPPSDDNAAPLVDQDPVPPSDANPAPAPPPALDTDVPPISSPTKPPTAPYTMNVRVHQTGTSPYFTIVEEGVWPFANGGTWTACEGQRVLKMGGSGTSGLLRFSDGADGFFIVALGIHSYKPWLDISPDIASDDTAVAVYPDWYKDGSERAKKREAQSETVEVKDKKGNAISASITKSADSEFWVTIVIGQEAS